MVKTVSEIRQFQQALKVETLAILNYWTTYSPDPADNGFYGQVSDNDIPDPEALKGSVLNARILWSLATGYLNEPQPELLQLAARAYQYFLKHFKDPQYGGAYWAITPPAHPRFTKSTISTNLHKKQVYAQAFWIYALSAYYNITKNEQVLNEAIELFNLIEKYSYDPESGGYYEAFTRDWSELKDRRLSPKDDNAVKTMNTHLHILEAYAALYKVWPDAFVLQQIQGLLDCFDQYIIDPETHHLKLFFDRRFNSQGTTVSYGHDIEAAWLLLEAANSIQEEQRIKKMQQHAIALATAVIAGIDGPSGGLNYERTFSKKNPSPGKGHLVAEKHWWVQAEAMVGFLEAYLQTENVGFLDVAQAVWQYIQTHLMSATGEWLWGIGTDGLPMKGYYKAGFWKCPYHNLRAMLETQKRLDIILDKMSVSKQTDDKNKFNC